MSQLYKKIAIELYSNEVKLAKQNGTFRIGRGIVEFSKQFGTMDDFEDFAKVFVDCFKKVYDVKIKLKNAKLYEVNNRGTKLAKVVANIDTDMILPPSGRDKEKWSQYHNFVNMVRKKGYKEK